MTVDSENRRLLLSTENIDELGLHDMVLEVYLPEFGVAHDQQFAALVSDCVVTELRLIPNNPPGFDLALQQTS